jgi:pimeloyl-ACP methyl ester carboxylesterase
MREHSFLSLGPSGFHRIAYSEWGDPRNRRVVVCGHGLTRNRHDFDFLAAMLSKEFRIVCMDFAGRGDSDWLPSTEDYRFSLYERDAAVLIARVTAPQRDGWFDRLDAALFSSERAVTVDWIGTSMGGLVGMALAARPNTPLRRLVLNDVGPLIPWTGLVRIKGYTGKTDRFVSIEEAEAYLRQACAPFGDLTDAQWRHLAQHGVRKLEDGVYQLNYDPEILRVLQRGRHMDMPLGARLMEGVDLWSIWDAVTAPTLILRGAESDVLTARVATEMTQRGPHGRLIEIPGVGHAPALMDAAQIESIRAFLNEG